jgi:acyl-coenzyme A thioesterase PaaI-like protein
LTLERVEGALLTRMRFTPPLIGNPLLPALHGGTLGALLESAAIFTLVAQTETERVPKIITLSVDFLL